MNTCARLIAATLIALISISGSAEIYKKVDAQGRTIYTDNPTAGDKVNQVDLPPINSQPSTRIEQRTRPVEQDTTPTAYDITIVEPYDQLQLGMGDQILNVSVSMAPPLHATHYLQAYLNGNPIGATSQSQNWSLQDIYRGTHQLTVSAFNSKGQIVGASPAVTIHVQRRSAILQPARPAP